MDQKQQVAAKLKEAKNVLVTVSADPSVDQLAACIGLTLMLNKLGKHATAVFSGQVPSTIEFLQPEATLETNTNSLRDFIIALDRNKADKLRYKLEDKVVRIFITPYKTSIDQDDLQFSDGDFNVDVVIALGVKQQQDIDQAVTAQGNILHDATVITLTTSDEASLGSIHWRDPAACGVSELAASLADSFDKNLLDEQIATAYLTGIVAQTERFSNNLTTSNTMKVSAQLMSAGANQQLVATKLEEPAPPPEPEPTELPEPEKSEKSDESDGSPESPAENPPAEPEPPKKDPGELEINHDKADEPASEASDNPSEPATEAEDDDSEAEASQPPTEENDDEPAAIDEPSREVLHGDGPETSPLTASSEEEPLEPSTDPFSLPPLDQPLLDHDSANEPTEDKPSADMPDSTPEEPAPTPPEPPQTVLPPAPPQPESARSKFKKFSPIKPKQTLGDIEANVHSPHLGAVQPPELPAEKYDNPSPPPEPPVNPLPSVSVDNNGLLIHHDESNPPPSDLKPAPGFESSQSAMNMPQPPLAPPTVSDDKPDGDNNPPPVPPPMVPPAQ